MGNCQAAEAAAVVVQHPGGKVERLYGPATAADVMRSNPGHYVALVVLRVSGPYADAKTGTAAVGGGAKITKVKLLKPKDTLLLGKVYRLITSQEVAKAIQARRQEKMRRCEEVMDDRRRRQSQPGHAGAAGCEKLGQSTDQERKQPEKDRHRSGTASGGGRGRHWRPSLQSISESAS
ncbi:uncharacterized protein LOC133898380 [Phragmites australis]|uniref:uncharacterized protein LOC133898380 n=1 Tax=Phragmites australis TaxID=29695 RepID=UPI002D799847|nr:uncharacterized protein LOC133898380 [Phragmites australis]